MTFAEAVKALRLKAGLTQTHLSQQANISQGLVSMIETGERIPAPEIVVRLGVALKLPGREAIAFLAVAGYASEEWRERASEDLDTYLGVGEDEDAPRDSIRTHK